MHGLPTGTVTFLFTDVEGSTDLLHRLGDSSYENLLQQLRQILRTVFESHAGVEVDSRGEEFFVAFKGAQDALAAAVEVQRTVVARQWPDEVRVGVRIGLHTGEPITTGGGYVGIDVHRAARICTAGHGGQILISQSTHGLVRDNLPPTVELGDLGRHRLKDLQQPEQLFQVLIAGLPRTFPPLRSLSALPNNLPVQLTSFVGRERELGEIKHVLSEHRLLTLTGIGGGGKTRLALQAAADLIEMFPHGVWLVDFSSVSSTELVIPTVASALRVREQPGQSISEMLTDDLRDKTILLVFDNCEHLIDACAGVAYELVRRSPGLRILTTSREPLRITGEKVYPVPPLALPDLTSLPSAEQLPTIEAVHLFVDRAALGQHQFVVTERTAPAISQIVARLDGIPLAIELAAGLTRVLSVTEIAERIEDRFRVLIGRSRTTVARHQTLLAAMDWSYELLSESERILFRRLAVFVGGFTLEAVEAVCADHGIDEHEILNLLSDLVDRSLVIAEQNGGENRYRLLETVRQYSRMRLEELQESGIVQSRHLQFFLHLAERVEPRLRGPDQQRWFNLLGLEHDNLRAALRWGVDTKDRTELALSLAAALWWFWYIRGYWTEGREWLTEVLTRGGSLSTSARAKALCGAGFLAWFQGDYGRAAVLSEEGVALSRRLGDKWALAFSLLTLGMVARRQDQYERALTLHDEGLTLFRELGNIWGIAQSLRLLGIVSWHRGEYARAAALFEESLALAESRDDKEGVASSLHGLARVAMSQGGDDRAAALLERSLTLFQELGDHDGLASSFLTLGRLAVRREEFARAEELLTKSLALCKKMGATRAVSNVLSARGYLALRQGDLRLARRELIESLAIRRKLGYNSDRWGVAACLEELAMLAAAERQPERAVRLFAAASGLREAIGAPLPPADHSQYDRHLTSARAALTDKQFLALWAEGRVTTLDRVIEDTLRAEANRLERFPSHDKNAGP